MKIFVHFTPPSYFLTLHKDVGSITKDVDVMRSSVESYTYQVFSQLLVVNAEVQSY